MHPNTINNYSSQINKPRITIINPIYARKRKIKSNLLPPNMVTQTELLKDRYPRSIS